MLTLAQHFQKLTGTLGDQPVAGRVDGEHVELTGGGLTLRGVLRDDAIDGEAAGTPWRALRVPP
jgi:hypothetical protein